MLPKQDQVTYFFFNNLLLPQLRIVFSIEHSMTMPRNSQLPFNPQRVFDILDSSQKLLALNSLNSYTFGVREEDAEEVHAEVQVVKNMPWYGREANPHRRKIYLANAINLLFLRSHLNLPAFIDCFNQMKAEAARTYFACSGAARSDALFELCKFNSGIILRFESEVRRHAQRDPGKIQELRLMLVNFKNNM